MRGDGVGKTAMPGWIKLDNERILLNTAKACEFFGVSRKTINAWAIKGAPKEARGWWDIQAMASWLIERDPATSENAAELNARKLKADTEYREAKAAREQLQREIAEGRFYPKDEVVGEWVRRVHEIRTAMLAIPRKVAAVFNDPDVRLVVESELTAIVREILERYSREGVYTPKPVMVARRKGRVQTSRKADGQRVGG